MPKLTKRTIDAIRPNPTKDVFEWDDELPLFGVRVKPSGVKSFVLQYRNKIGASKRLTIGRYGTLTPEEARKSVRILLAEVAGGHDPAAKRAADRDAITVKALCLEYLEEAERGNILKKTGSPKRASTLYTDKGRVHRHILPLLGHRPVADISTADIQKFQRDVKAGKTAADVKTGKRGRAIVQGGRGAATRTLGLLGSIFSYAVQMGYRADNPVRGVVREKDARRQVRLSAEQYHVLGLALDAAAGTEAWQAIAAARLIALTGARRGEIETLKWAEVDLRNRCMTLSESKTGRSVRPIGAAVVAILTSLKPLSSGTYVLSGVRTKGGPYRGFPKAWSRIIDAAGLAEITPHTLRHSFSSMADDAGLSVPTIAALIGHHQPGTTARYIHKTDAALIAAADRVSGMISAAMSGNNAEVLPLQDHRRGREA